MRSCGLWERMCQETGWLIASDNLGRRYTVYNAWFSRQHAEGADDDGQA